LCFARFRAKLRPQPGKSLLHRKLASFESRPNLSRARPALISEC
jgi:hypothetical protein